MDGERERQKQAEKVQVLDLAGEQVLNIDRGLYISARSQYSLKKKRKKEKRELCPKLAVRAVKQRLISEGLWMEQHPPLVPNRPGTLAADAS